MIIIIELVLVEATKCNMQEQCIEAVENKHDIGS